MKQAPRVLFSKRLFSVCLPWPSLSLLDDTALVKKLEQKQKPSKCTQKTIKNDETGRAEKIAYKTTKVKHSLFSLNIVLGKD